jgi:hypothetical protein
MPRVEGGGVFVDGPSVAAVSSGEPGVVDLEWNGWLPMYRLDGRSPDERAKIHGINVANRRHSIAAFGAFLERLVEAARRCRTEDEVIALGRPRLPEGPPEPGARRGERKDLDAIDSDRVHLVREALAELGRIRARLAGRREPLDVALEAKVGLRLENAKGSCAIGAGLQGGLDGGCKASAGAGEGVEADGTARRALAAGPVSVTFAGDRIESVELSRGPAYARLERSSAAVGLGGRRTLATGPGGARLSAEARLGVDVRLLDAETVRRALSGEDCWAKKR